MTQDTASGLDFLNIGPSAQILAMGEGTVAVPTGTPHLQRPPLRHPIVNPVDGVCISWTTQYKQQ